jgi:hypothetical protein
MNYREIQYDDVGVMAAVVAIIIVVGAIFACNNSIGSDTSGDDTRAVVNNAPPAADINTVIPTASVNPRYRQSDRTNDQDSDCNMRAEFPSQ